MTTLFEQSGKKVLKKCKECGIYPSYYADQRGLTYFSVFRCPKCFEVRCSANDNMPEARRAWNKANGLDENDESTWHDEQPEKCGKCNASMERVIISCMGQSSTAQVCFKCGVEA